jgi:hypothetical protein
VRGDIPIDSKILLVTDFVNLKIKLIQSFKSAHRDRVCVCAFIEISAHTCMSIYIYTVFLKKISDFFKNNDSENISAPYPSNDKKESTYPIIGKERNCAPRPRKTRYPANARTVD